MAVRYSAGILLYRRRPKLEVLLGHMGGPFWARKDQGAWSIPKGEYEPGDEEPWDAARREFLEELGLPAPAAGEPLDLGEVVQSGGKRVRAYAVEGDVDPDAVTPGTFTMEWPPRSGAMREYPEVDRVAWFGVGEAEGKVVKSQGAFVERLVERLGGQPGGG